MKIVCNVQTGVVTVEEYTAAELAYLESVVPIEAARQAAAAQRRQEIAADKALVATFMDAASGTATAAQRDDVTKAVISYLRRRGDDA